MTIAPPTLANLVAETTGLSREEWLKLRKLGGSDAATVAGLNPYKSRYARWVDLINGVEEDFDNERMEWGRRLEPVIADAFAERTGLAVHKFPYLLAHPQHDWMTANVDRLVEGTGPELLEIKTTGKHLAEGWATDRVPDYYMLQGQHYLGVTGLPAVWFAVLIGGQEMRYTRVERDEALIGDLIEIEGAFWHLVETETPPEIDGSESSLDAVKRRFEPDPGSIVELDPKISTMLIDRATAKRTMAACSELVDRIDAQIMDAMGAAEIGQVNGETVVTWKGQTRSSVDTKALKAESPEIAAKFTKTTTFRRFTPKLKGEL